jgi:cyclic beta-1,2-glucan synthetase
MQGMEDMAAANYPVLGAGQAVPEPNENESLSIAPAAETTQTAEPTPPVGAADPLALLEARWTQTHATIRAARHKLQDIPRADLQPFPGVRRFVDQAILLRKALRETRDALRSARKMSGVEVLNSPSGPRPYVAARSFLEAANFDFEKKSFVAFLATFQEGAALQFPELCLLKPLTELALLEYMSEIVNTWNLEEASRGSAAAQQADTVDDQLSVLIGSLERLMDCEWEDVLNEASATEAILRLDPSGHYLRMDLESRQMYRGAISDLAARSHQHEQEIARAAVRLAEAAQITPIKRARERRTHVGYYLIDKGKKALEETIGYRPSAGQRIQEMILRQPAAFYFFAVGLVTAALLLLFAAIVGTKSIRIPELFLLLLPGLECALGAVNLTTPLLIPPRKLPKLDFSDGIPAEATTLAVIPILLTSEAQVRQAVRDVEIRYLANCDANLHFALLTDPPDSLTPLDEKDALADLCSDLVRNLNEKYARQEKGTFLHFHRQRIYNAAEEIWMGWERKRGKLLDLNNLILGRSDNFPVKVGDLSVLSNVKYVITLDQDTQLPKDAAHKLIGTLAHPLNRAAVDPVTNTVVEGYGILQPRVEVSVRSANRSRLAAIFSGETGYDIYTRAVSDVYQDLFGEGIFTGKGIYEVETFQQVLDGRFPPNVILSHDLIEGLYARTGLVSDLEVIDDYPSHVSAYSRRRHRWIRGDWQIVRWLLPGVPEGDGRVARNPLSFVSRWKIVDNLRRSLTDFAIFTLLLCGWLVLPGRGLYWTLATLALLCTPTFIQLTVSIVGAGRARNRVVFWKNLAHAAGGMFARLFLRLTLLCYQGLVGLDAVVRTIVRMSVTHKRLLQWETAAQAELGAHKTDPVESLLGWTPWISAAIMIAVAIIRPSSLPVAIPFLLAWAGSRTICQWLDRPHDFAKPQMSAADKTLLRNAALRTWRFFREFGASEENWLIPDIVQEPPGLVAHRLSPTNLGLLLDSRLAAYDLGYLTLPEFANASERTFQTLRQMPTKNGHFYNWYDSLTLQPVPPRFISTVDSGNLVCGLWTLRQGCLAAVTEPLFRKALWEGIYDHLVMIEDLIPEGGQGEHIALAVRRLKARVQSQGTSNWARLETLPNLAAELNKLQEVMPGGRASEESSWWTHELSLRVSNIQNMVYDFVPWVMPQFAKYRRELGIHRLSLDDLTTESLTAVQSALDEKLQRIEANGKTDDQGRAEIRLLRSLLARSGTLLRNIAQQLSALAAAADEMAKGMDFSYLYNPQKKLLSIGYDVEKEHVHECVYDLMASEARAAAFVAIAKRDIPQESWHRLGRVHTQVKNERGLLSWTGTMFEYLMPSLWMKSHPNSLLGHSARIAVRAQQDFVAEKGIPWGISESSCRERNPDGHYRYQAFGIPALAISQPESDTLVITPYAAFLSLLVDIPAAVENLRRMRRMGWLGAYGYYEACDFTPSSGSRQGGEIVRCWMAHHQGMTLVALANVLCDSSMQRHFHMEPMVAANERLLQEKVPAMPAFESLEEQEERLPSMAIGDTKSLVPAD